MKPLWCETLCAATPVTLGAMWVTAWSELQVLLLSLKLINMTSSANAHGEPTGFIHRGQATVQAKQQVTTNTCCKNLSPSDTITERMATAVVISVIRLCFYPDP